MTTIYLINLGHLVKCPSVIVSVCLVLTKVMIQVSLKHFVK